MISPDFGVLPCMKCAIRGISFEVFQAKVMGQDWASHLLREAVLRERRTYLRYGDVEPLDQYDENATIYLVSAVHCNTGVDIEERFSVRFVSGESMTLDEAEKFLSHDLKQVNFFTEIHSQMAFASRACGSTNTTPEHSTKNIRGINASRMISTPYAFALSIEHFFKHTKVGFQTNYLLAIIRDEVLTHSLSTWVLQNYVPRFVSISEFVNKEFIHNVRMNRNIDAFRFPGYFFNCNELRVLFKELLLSRKLSPHTLAGFVGGEDAVSNLLSNKRISTTWTKNLGELLVFDGIIKDSLITGDELRCLINAHVSDGPRLRVLERAYWDEDFKHFRSR